VGEGTFQGGDLVLEGEVARGGVAGAIPWRWGSFFRRGIEYQGVVYLYGSLPLLSYEDANVGIAINPARTVRGRHIPYFAREQFRGIGTGYA
jgi:hypothetical protein